MRKIKFRVWDGGVMDYEPVFPKETNLNSILNYNGFMQFTGLHDKNGKEIYEGDILNIAYDQMCIGHVIFTDGVFKTTAMDANYRLDQKSILNDESEIIGNIYENPELLE